MSDAEMISTLKTDVYFAGAYRDHYVRRKAAFFQTFRFHDHTNSVDKFTDTFKSIYQQVSRVFVINSV